MVTTGVLLASTTLGLASGAAGATTISGGAVPVTVSDTGTANQPGGVAISATGCATNGYANVSGSCTSGGTVDVTAIGTATGGAAATGSGYASGGWASVAGDGSANGGPIAVAGTGSATAPTCTFGTGVAVSGTGSASSACGPEASGGFAVATVTGAVATTVGTISTTVATVTATVNGTVGTVTGTVANGPVGVGASGENVSEPGGVAVSNGGCASDGYANVTTTGCTSGGTAGASGTGSASSGVAVSGTDDASGSWAAVSGTEDATGAQVVVAPDGNATTNRCNSDTPEPTAVSVTGEATAPCGTEASGADSAEDVAAIVDTAVGMTADACVPGMPVLPGTVVTVSLESGECVSTSTLEVAGVDPGVNATNGAPSAGEPCAWRVEYQNKFGRNRTESGRPLIRHWPSSTRRTAGCGSFTAEAHVALARNDRQPGDPGLAPSYGDVIWDVYKEACAGTGDVRDNNAYTYYSPYFRMDEGPGHRTIDENVYYSGPRTIEWLIASSHRFDQGANGTVEGNRIMDMVDSYEVQ